MEAATATPEPDVLERQGPPIADLAPEVPEEPAERRSPKQMFCFAGWVHIGPGADECPDVDENASTNTCARTDHFHAWCRMPNQYQREEIREKALAAKARRRRELNDPDTDGYLILEGDMDELAEAGDEGKEAIVTERLTRDWPADYLEAMRDVQDEDADEPDPDDPDGDAPKKWAHIEDDQRRHAVLREMNEEELLGHTDELDSLDKHLTAYGEAIEARLKEIQEPKREAMLEREIGELVDEVRGDRVRQDSTAAFTATWDKWEWYIGSLSFVGGPRVFASIGELEQAAPEVHEILKAHYQALDRARQEGLTGNS